MVQEHLWLISPIAIAWLLQKLFHDVFHPALSEREVVTSEGKKEINPYFNLGYAASPYKKQKDSFLKVIYGIAFPLYAIIVLPILWIDNPVDHVLDDQEIKFSAPVKFSGVMLAAVYLAEVVWNELEVFLRTCHHLVSILSVFLVVTESDYIPPALIFIRISWLPFHDWFPFNIASLLYRFNWVEDHTFWQTLRAYYYLVGSLIIFTLDWLFLIYISKEKNFGLYVCVAIWELTELYGIYMMRDFVQHLPEIIKKKIERETKYVTELDQVEEDPCGGESFALDVASDVQCGLSLTE